jgi:hypothetical protein
LARSPSYQSKIEEMAVEQFESQLGRTLPQDMRLLLIREMRIGSIVMNALLPLIMLPLLILGVRFIAGPEHRIWAWQQARRARHPIVAGILFPLGFSALRPFIQRLLNPAPEQFANIKPYAQTDLDLYLAPVFAAICLLLSAWFYIGRKKGENEIVSSS